MNCNCFNAWYYKLIIVLDRENHCANQKKYTRPISIYFNTLCTKKILVDYLIFRYTELLPRFVLPVNICDQHSPYIWSYLPLDHVLVILSNTIHFTDDMPFTQLKVPCNILNQTRKFVGLYLTFLFVNQILYIHTKYLAETFTSLSQTCFLPRLLRLPAVYEKKIFSAV